jgi:broad specificity phosphatase PhoE
MGQLTLIRHGQAHAFSDDSDRLTELGKKQAERLGEYWLECAPGFTDVYSGKLKRQRDTAQIALKVLSQAEPDLPAVQALSAFNEYDAAGVMNILAPRLLETDEEFRHLHAAFQLHQHDADRNRYFQKMFEYLMNRWMNGSLTAEDVESFADFTQRVSHALKEILAQATGGRHVAIFTSGGVIGLIVQSALQAPPQQMLALNWRVRNCSLTEFTFSRDRLSLDSFNTIPHLNDPALRSYR